MEEPAGHCIRRSLEADVAGEDLEVAVRAKHGDVRPKRDSRDEAVSERTHGLARPPARWVRSGGGLVVGQPLYRRLDGPP